MIEAYRGDARREALQLAQALFVHGVPDVDDGVTTASGKGTEPAKNATRSTSKRIEKHTHKKDGLWKTKEIITQTEDGMPLY